MKEGTVGAILDFSMRDDFVEESAHQAFHEFFGIAVNDCPEPDELPDRDIAYFSEWLVFDFRLPNGKTLLEYYIERNPDNLSGVELKTYRDLLTNEYGLWEILEIELGLCMKLRNVQTDQPFEVKECRGTFGLRKGNLFYGRVALVEGRWELVTGTTHVWDVRLGGGAKEYFRKAKDRLSPKDAWRFANDVGSEGRGAVTADEPMIRPVAQ